MDIPEPDALHPTAGISFGAQGSLPAAGPTTADDLPAVALPGPGLDQPEIIRKRCAGAEGVTITTNTYAFLRQRHTAEIARLPHVKIPTLEILAANGVPDSSPLMAVWRRLPATLEGAEHRASRARARRLLDYDESFREFAAMAAGSLLRTLSTAPRADLVADFAFPYTGEVIARFLGGGITATEVSEWSDALNHCFYAMSPSMVRRAESAVAEIQLRIHSATAAQQSETTVGMLGAIGRLDETGRRDEDRLMENTALVANVVFGGHDTTAKSIANALLCLLMAPEQQQAVLDGDVALSDLVEEALRFQPSVAGVTRVLVEPAVISGVAIPAGATVMALGLVGNRDATVFPEPDTFIPTRKPNPHVSFGGASPHHCLGTQLARMLISEALRAYLDHGASWRLAEQPAALPWWPANTFRGVAELPVLTGVQGPER